MAVFQSSDIFLACQRVKELEHQNEQWKLENIKLYQNKASLLDLIQQQNERIREIRASDPEKNNKIMELNAELQKTRAQRDDLARAHSAYNNTPSQLQQNFLHLQGDYVRVIISYRAVCAEVERLQDLVRTLTEPKPRSQPQGLQTQNQHHPQHQAQQQSQHQSRPQVQQRLQSQPLHQSQSVYVQSNHHTAQRQPTPTILQPHVQKYVQQPQSVPTISRPQPGQQTNTQSPPAFVQVQKQKNLLSQTQQAIFEQGYQAILQSQQPRSWQSSGSMPTSTWSGQDSFVNMTNPQQHGPSASSLSRPTSTPHSNGLRAAQSTSPMVPVISEPLTNQLRTFFSNKSGPPSPVLPSHSPLSQVFFAPPGLDFSLDPPTIPMHPLNKVSSTSIELLQPNTSTSVPLTISQDTYLNFADQTSPPAKDVQNFNTSTSSNAGRSILPVKVPAVSQPVNVVLGLPASIASQINSLKRDTPTGSEGHHDVMEEQLQKRLRLERPQLELTTITPVEPAADGTEDIVQMDEDEVVEVGPDGLRLVKDCIFDLFGEEGERKGEGDRRYCKLCIARRTMGYRINSPKPFINATNDELQEHCMTEHAEAWDTLRQSI